MKKGSVFCRDGEQGNWIILFMEKEVDIRENKDRKAKSYAVVLSSSSGM